MVPSKAEVHVYSPEAQLSVLLCTEVSRDVFPFSAVSETKGF